MNDQIHAEPRRRNAANSRERLLAAAGELFSERGYTGTTVREVGTRAGVDPALIARYFGSKSALYLAWLRPDQPPTGHTPPHLTDATAIEEILVRPRPHGPSPTMWAAVQPHQDPELQSAAMELLEDRIVRNAEADARAADLDEPQLRAEIAAAALAGIILSRTSRAFETLGSAEAAEVARLVAQLFRGILAEPN